ncbi:hypothetical protein KUTeg_016105 [Tegillarca granosa]|uniref:Uncharacterized protein n=1 Tax=Tegillarca granosa TaxID=220873 RepID=A0ABQ9EPR4_TEGGR|nr:hypothetical protein KUTeg_016105 [Tegillarca granosa]
MQSAMEMLRKEVTSLMDQDLSLMKQLLTLNETIEELKFKRLNQVCKDSLKSASLELIESDSNSNMAETRHLSGSQNSLSNRSQILETLNQNDVIGSSSSDSVQYKFFMNGNNTDADESDEEYMLTKDIKSWHKIQICNDSGYEESGSDQDYTGTTL